MSRVPLLPNPVGQELVGLASPPDWARVFGQAGPMELEIGCGAGGFALDYASRWPQVRYVALEWRKKFARELDRRSRSRGLANLKVVEADARIEVPRLFSPGSLAAIHVHFPDPWWKRAHQKRSILTPAFCGVLFELLSPGGEFDLRTDVQERASAMLAALEGAGFVNPLGPGSFHPRDPEDIPSTRERRYLTTGTPIYRARLRKGGGQLPASPPPP
jgi:tRNA (guanine-N7-)-methyltransferase